MAVANKALEHRNAELGHTNDDLINLLGSVHMAIVMVGPDHRIRRFTPLAEQMLSLIATDVGRPITDLNINFDVSDLSEILVTVANTVQPYHREVQNRNGRWYALQVRPYRTPDDRVDGAVLMLVDIDALKQTERSLRDSEARLQIIFDRAPMGMFETDLSGRFRRVNDQFCELTGYSREVLLARRSQDITHPDDVAADVETFDRVASGLPAERREKRYLRDDGTALWAEVHRFAVTDAHGAPAFTVGVAEDISERKETETALRRREARFRALMNSAPALIWVTGLLGMEYVNQAYLEFLGVESHEVLGNSWTYFLHPEEREGYAEAYQSAAANLQPFERQFRFRRADGEYRWMMSIALPQFGPAGKFAGYTGATFDITALKNAETTLRTADQRKDEFIAMLAHELRNPLAPITNIVQMMKSETLDAHTLDWAYEVLDRQLRHVGRMVNDLLDASRVSRGKIQLQPERLELNELVTRSVDALRPTIEAGRKKIAIELPPRPIVLFADPMRLEQVISNLVQNAVKFTPQNGQIWVTAGSTDGGGEVRISVRDNGDGIDADALPHVFDLFMQGNSSLERAQGGLGIGLTLVRGLVELHGGSIEARSDGADRGSEFIVRLPVLDAPPRERPPAAAPTHVLPQRILIVDDNVDAAQALGALLRQGKHEVAVAHSGSVALDMARTFKPHVALVDLGMPG